MISTTDASTPLLSPTAKEEIVGDCAICLDEIKNTDDKIKTVCNHVFHDSCMGAMLASTRYAKRATVPCPLCRATLETKDIQPLPLIPSPPAPRAQVNNVDLFPCLAQIPRKFSIGLMVIGMITMLLALAFLAHPPLLLGFLLFGICSFFAGACSITPNSVPVNVNQNTATA